MSNSKELARPLLLGIEGGATHTVAIVADANGKLIQRFEAGPANIKLLTDEKLTALLKTVACAVPAPDAIGIGMAGARDESDWSRIRSAAAVVWANIPCKATNDLETALSATEDKNANAPKTRVLILSGTGSCCYGINAAGKIAKVGGWGHLLGDKGSGYEIGLRGLKAVVYYYDRDGKWPKLGAQLLHRLQLNEPNQLIAWAQSAEKAQIAVLATEVFDAWKKKDKIAIDILEGAKSSLAKDGIACAKHLGGKAPVHFVLAGSVLTKQPAFSAAIATALKKNSPKAVVSILDRDSVWGAVSLAKEVLGKQALKTKSNNAAIGKSASEPKSLMPEMPLADLVKKSPTEQRNPLSVNIDRMPISEAIELILSEDAKIPAAILKEKEGIAQAVKLITQAFKNGGRLFYIGAGTSGRLGVLDASECPPTFRTSPDLVQGIIAGGQGALWRSVEGAEDDPTAGARAIEFRNVTKKDVVVGIAASGRTPYVWGGIGEAKKRGAKTVLVGFNPYLAVTGKARPDVMITPNVGPEILTGSTRLKSGTATKLVLNIFTTLAMVGIGKVASNLMIDLNPSNIKLRDRAVRIIRELSEVDYATAEKALDDSKWVIKDALRKLPKRKRA